MPDQRRNIDVARLRKLIYNNANGPLPLIADVARPIRCRDVEGRNNVHLNQRGPRLAVQRLPEHVHQHCGLFDFVGVRIGRSQISYETLDNVTEP